MFNKKSQNRSPGQWDVCDFFKHKVKSNILSRLKWIESDGKLKQYVVRQNYVLKIWIEWKEHMERGTTSFTGVEEI